MKKMRAAITALCFLAMGLSAFAGPADLKLSPDRQKVVDPFMNVLLTDARSDFAFRQVYDAFKAEKKEYMLLDYFKKLLQLKRDQPEASANLHLILGRLYEAFRDPYQAGMEYQEAAQVMGCPLGTLKSRVARAREAFAREYVKNHPNRLPVTPVGV